MIRNIATKCLPSLEKSKDLETVSRQSFQTLPMSARACIAPPERSTNSLGANSVPKPPTTKTPTVPLSTVRTRTIHFKSWYTSTAKDLSFAPTVDCPKPNTASKAGSFGTDVLPAVPKKWWTWVTNSLTTFWPRTKRIRKTRTKRRTAMPRRARTIVMKTRKRRKRIRKRRRPRRRRRAKRTRKNHPRMVEKKMMTILRLFSKAKRKTTLDPIRTKTKLFPKLVLMMMAPWFLLLKELETISMGIQMLLSMTSLMSLQTSKWLLRSRLTTGLRFLCGPRSLLNSSRIRKLKSTLLSSRSLQTATRSSNAI
mmetsp:Transcript_17153/g.35390  ORF Transcript_17153/g.35390 Transcript_17153/m.35390 type:complete len:310 (-) Transcript_17153:375-1304(-)